MSQEFAAVKTWTLSLSCFDELQTAKNSSTRHSFTDALDEVFMQANSKLERRIKHLPELIFERVVGKQFDISAEEVHLLREKAREDKIKEFKGQSSASFSSSEEGASRTIV
jgi:hypothetical protein